MHAQWLIVAAGPELSQSSGPQCLVARSTSYQVHRCTGGCCWLLLVTIFDNDDGFWMDLDWWWLMSINLTLVDMMALGGIWLSWLLFHVVSKCQRAPVFHVAALQPCRDWEETAARPSASLIFKANGQMLCVWGQVATTGFSVRQTLYTKWWSSWMRSSEYSYVYQLLTNKPYFFVRSYLLVISWRFLQGFDELCSFCSKLVLQVSHSMVPRSPSIWQQDLV